MEHRSRSEPRRLRTNFAWAFLGNTVYNLVQWILVVFLARFGTLEMVGHFALAQAIAAPVFLTLGLNLRAVRATDVRRVWSSSQYMRLRLVLNAASLAVTIGVGLLVGLRSAALGVLIMISLSKATEATSHTLYGYFQVNDRLDLVSRSMLLRALLGSICFVTALMVWSDAVLACAGLALGWSVVYIFHDRGCERRLRQYDLHRTDDGNSVWSLVRKASPLGVDAGISSLTNNVPRYGVQALLGTTALGAYAALAYLGQTVAMITGSLADSLIGRLARQAEAGNCAGFLKTLRLLFGFALVVSAAAAIGSWLVGEVFIELLLGSEYVNQPVLILLMAGAGILTLQRCLGRGLQAAHRYQAVLWMDSVTLITTLLAAAILIPEFGLAGAAATLGVGFIAGIAFGAVLLNRAISAMNTGDAKVVSP